MKVWLFITCFDDTLRPTTGHATVKVLELLGQTVYFPVTQTCCGQTSHFSSFNTSAKSASPCHEPTSAASVRSDRSS